MHKILKNEKIPLPDGFTPNEGLMIYKGDIREHFFGYIQPDIIFCYCPAQLIAENNPSLKKGEAFSQLQDMAPEIVRNHRQVGYITSSIEEIVQKTGLTYVPNPGSFKVS